MVNKLIILLAYAVLGFYFVNYPFNFVEIPEIVAIYDKWIIFAGGILVLYGALNHMRTPSRMPD